MDFHSFTTYTIAPLDGYVLGNFSHFWAFSDTLPHSLALIAHAFRCFPVFIVTSFAFCSLWFIESTFFISAVCLLQCAADLTVECKAIMFWFLKFFHFSSLPSLAIISFQQRISIRQLHSSLHQQL